MPTIQSVYNSQLISLHRLFQHLMTVTTCDRLICIWRSGTYHIWRSSLGTDHICGTEIEWHISLKSYDFSLVFRNSFGRLFSVSVLLLVVGNFGSAPRIFKEISSGLLIQFYLEDGRSLVSIYRTEVTAFHSSPRHDIQSQVVWAPPLLSVAGLTMNPPCRHIKKIQAPLRLWGFTSSISYSTSKYPALRDHPSIISIFLWCWCYCQKTQVGAPANISK